MKYARRILLLVLIGTMFHTTIASAITIRVKFGDYRGCNPGMGICSIEILCSSDAKGNADARVVGNRLEIRMTEPLPAGATDRQGSHQTLVIEEDILIKLDEACAKELGVKTLTVRSGAYRIDADGGFGTFKVKAEIEAKEKHKADSIAVQ